MGETRKSTFLLIHMFDFYLSIFIRHGPYFSILRSAVTSSETLVNGYSVKMFLYKSLFATLHCIIFLGDLHVKAIAFHRMGLKHSECVVKGLVYFMTINKIIIHITCRSISSHFCLEVLWTVRPILMRISLCV